MAEGEPGRSPMSTFTDELEANARARFVRWDSALWRELTGGAAQRLGQALFEAGTPAAQGEELLRAYLQLGAEAIGLGYLYPTSAGRQNFFTLAWSDLIPRLLAAVPSAERSQVFAQLWNLGENLESAPPWVQRIFWRVGRELTSLQDIEARLRETSSVALEPPDAPLAARAQAHWVDLSKEDSRFLPGPIHFLSPTVVCVHDRHRQAVAGRDAATQGIWLAETPVRLGAMGCREVPEQTHVESPHLDEALREDPRADAWFATLSNDWRVVATLHTSQHVLVFVPE
ncbi:hypothetical protein MXAN_0308 [Myxococcus xanthus DK 1622]|uniref:Uncharacterized protein n=2 Tax=Myxococcaceae TaxID=31 RepID=Q1DFI5_MYXXD|nr:hypothetical protein MXAN_0308 [Myxococcus xanthus DK 1622]NOJ56760.1 hypothetical protein [Myxococcus xanthus]